MEELMFEPSLWQNPQGSIRINLSWTGDEGTSPARLTAFPFLILSHASVAPSSSAPRSGANPISCFSSRKINLTFQVTLFWPTLSWWEKSMIYSGHLAEHSQHIDLSPTDYLQRHQSVRNVECSMGKYAPFPLSFTISVRSLLHVASLSWSQCIFTHFLKHYSLCEWNWLWQWHIKH